MAEADERAEFFKETYEHWQKLYHLALTLLSNPDEAEDAVQDVFIKAAEKRKQFQGKSSLYTWLVRILINHCHDLRRKRVKRSENSIDEDHESALADVRINLEKKIELSEVSRSLIIRVNELSDIYREVIVLRFFENLSYAEIADILSVSEGTVKSRISSARNILRSELSSSGITGGELDS